MSNPNQRTKGNAKPSNSDRAARLLTSNAFLSFSAASQTLSGVYAANTTAAVAAGDNDSSSFKYGLSSDFQVIFKHMTKKDINTKLKALQDFTALCSSKETDELLQTAAFWYRIYRKLSNVIDWRVRQEVHNAHYQFLSKFDRDVIASDIQNVIGANGDADSESPSEVSFQNLITMPATMWTSCFDVYSQAADSAKKAFNFLHPSERSRVDFILANYDSILNYCTYCIFEKIPLKLFYTTPLPPDSVKVFEEHMLVTCLRGLSSLINELICFYIEAESGTDDHQLQGQVFQCLEQIFSRLNTEFGKSKFAHFGSKAKPATAAASVDNPADSKTNDGAFLSKKEKKKLRKEEKDKENADKEATKGAKSQCKFWTYFASENISIRVSFFHALNSITRLTSLMFDSQHLKDSSIFEQLNTANQLWFKLYKTNLYENIFKSFVDPVAEVRGLAWLLGTHVLNYRALYKPWSVLNHDKWLKDTLVAFISNGMRTAGGTIDFGLFNIGLEKCQRLYPEFFSKKYSHLSGLQLTCTNYAELDILANVKLVIVFADAFNCQQEDQFSLKIFETLLFALNDAFNRVVLQSDTDFIIEIYFNLIYHLVRQCLQLPLKSKVDQLPNGGNLVEEMKLNALFRELFQTHLHNILQHSMNATTSDLLFNSQIYLNLLLLVNNTAEYYRELSRNDSDYDVKTLLQVYNLFKFNVQTLYSNIFKLIETELQSHIEDRVQQTNFQLNRILRFLNDSILFQFDGYFSAEFYYGRGNTNYDKNALKLLHTGLNRAESEPSSGAPKRVNFGGVDDADDEVKPPSKQTTSGKADWWTARQQQSIFSFSVANSGYCQRAQRTPISLLTEYGSLVDDVNSITVKLIALLDHRLHQLAGGASRLTGKAANDDLFLIALHVQYILRAFNSQQFTRLFSQLQPAGEEGAALDNFIGGYLIRWIDSIYECASRQQHQLGSLRFHVMLCRKVYDILLTCLCTQDDVTRATQLKTLCCSAKPFAFCVLLHHIDQLATLPMSPHYASVIAQFRSALVDSSASLTSLLHSQLDFLFTASQSKTLDCDILFNVILFALSQGELGYERSVEQKESQMSRVGQMLSRLHQHLSRSDTAQVDSLPFIVEFPLLCREVYRLLFSSAHLLNSIEDFELTFVNFTKLFFRQMFDCSVGNSKQNEATVKAFVDNASTFWKFALQMLFDTLPKYETSLTLTIRELIAIAVDGVVLAERWNSDNYQLIIRELNQLLEVLLDQYKAVFTDSSDEASEVKKQFTEFQANFNRKISEKVHLFTRENIVAYLYDLEEEEGTSISKLFATYEIFLVEERVNILEQMNDSDLFDAQLQAKLPVCENSLYLSTCQASVVRSLLINAYLDPVYSRKHLNFDLLSLLSSPSSSPFDLLPTIRTLLVSLYHFDRFLKFYFYQNANAPKCDQLKDIYRSFREELEAILCALKTVAKRTGDDNQRVMLQLIHFLISDQSQDISCLCFANFLLKNFFPCTNWMEILNHIGLPGKFEQPLVSKIALLAIAQTENISKVNEILSQALRHFESAAISESYSEAKAQVDGDKNEETQKEATLFDWSRLSTEDVNSIFFVIDVAFHKLATVQPSEEEKAEAIAELRERLLNFLTLLTWSKLEKLFEPNIPSLSNSKYLTFLLCCQLLTDAVPCLEGSSRPHHFAMFLTVLKLWVQILYTSLPESIEKEQPQELRVLLMASQMLSTVNVFGRRALAMPGLEDDSLLEMIEMWRNFVAFDSFNMLLPLFIVLNNCPKRNLIEKTYLKRLIQTMDYVDMECLQDISTLELNQYLLMYPDEKSSQRTLETMLNRFIENANLGEEHSPSRSNCATLTLTPSNTYFDYLLNYATPLLLHSDINWSTSAFHILSIMFQDLPWSQKDGMANRKSRNDVDDSLSLDSISSSLLNEKELQLGPPESFRTLLEKLDKVTEYILMDCEFGEAVMIDPNSDVYNYIFAYLLVWLLYLHLIDPFSVGESQESRADLIGFLAERGLHFRLFDHLFHLMHSLEDVEEEETEAAGESIVGFLRKIKNLRETQNLRELLGGRSADSLPKLALCVYYHVLRNLPHLLRSWFGNLKPMHKQVVDDFTVHHCSHVLIEKELDALKAADRDKFGNIVVTSSKKTNEITAVYSLREISFGIKLSFNENFPLTTVKIECINRSGVSEDRCRKWIQRLTIFFNKQNCSIMEGIARLRPNMDKFFEGIEECMICLFVLYGATSDLPRFKCPQCRKKFHFACIRKWFQTNNSRTCPQCKYEFIY